MESGSASLPRPHRRQPGALRFLPPSLWEQRLFQQARGALLHRRWKTPSPRERIYFGNYSAQPMTAMRQRIPSTWWLPARFASRVFDR